MSKAPPSDFTQKFKFKPRVSLRTLSINRALFSRRAYSNEKQKTVQHRLGKDYIVTEYCHFLRRNIITAGPGPGPGQVVPKPATPPHTTQHQGCCVRQALVNVDSRETSPEFSGSNRPRYWSPLQRPPE
ncbi:hypothetical protein FQR65_LT11408 [Abscondita terminalis]|nr:hypothetical protein FQR65_LT11408 [Abscondita terminalis]